MMMTWAFSLALGLAMTAWIATGPQRRAIRERRQRNRELANRISAGDYL